MKIRLLSFCIGLVLPYISVLSGIYYFRFSKDFILGFPPLYFWVFIWFFLASACISVAWQIDKKDYADQ